MSPGKLPSVEGILRGTVPAAWAAEHHPKWVPGAAALGSRQPGFARRVAAAAVVGLGAALLVLLVFT
jgi:hypothetical protein